MVKAFFVFCLLTLPFSLGWKLARAPRALFSGFEIEKTTLFYVVPETSCPSCLDGVDSFVRRMEEERNVLDQQLMIISPTETDRQNFAAQLGLPPTYIRHDKVLRQTETIGIGPMMFLLTPTKKVLLVRPLSMIGHEPGDIKRDIVQLALAYEGR